MLCQVDKTNHPRMISVPGLRFFFKPWDEATVLGIQVSCLVFALGESGRFGQLCLLRNEKYQT